MYGERRSCQPKQTIGYRTWNKAAHSSNRLSWRMDIPRILAQFALNISPSPPLDLRSILYSSISNFGQWNGALRGGALFFLPNPETNLIAPRTLSTFVPLSRKAASMVVRSVCVRAASSGVIRALGYAAAKK